MVQLVITSWCIAFYEGDVNSSESRTLEDAMAIFARHGAAVVLLHKVWSSSSRRGNQEGKDAAWCHSLDPGMSLVEAG